MGKPLTRAELDATRHGTLMDCGCKVCRLLATIEVLAAEVVAGRGRLWCDGQAMSHSREIERIEYCKARELTDAAGILPTTSTPPR